jgi:hypothetical protein
MTKPQFKRALTLAHSNAELPAYLSAEMHSAIGGCALDTRRRYVRLEHVAALIRGHCQTFAGTWNYAELADIESLSKRFDLI